MTMDVNKVARTEFKLNIADKNFQKAKKEFNPLLKFQKQEEDNARTEKFFKLTTVYTDKNKYKAALEKAIANGTYNPDAPEFILADKKMVKNMQKLEQAAGQKIFNEDGSINTNAYKKAMILISGNLDIDATESKFAKELGFSKSELKDLAKPLGIKLLSKKESKDPRAAHSLSGEKIARELQAE